MSIVRQCDTIINLQTGEVGIVVKIDRDGYRNYLIQNSSPPYEKYWESPWNVDHYSIWKHFKIKLRRFKWRFW